AAVDDDVALLHLPAKLVDRVLGRPPGRQHHPHRARLLELADEIRKRIRRRGALARQRIDRTARAVEDRAAMSIADQPPHQIGAHAAEPDHPELHAPTPQLNARSAAAPSAASPALTSCMICARNARRPRSASTRKSPRACAALTTPNVAFRPGISRSAASSQVTCRNTPLFGPPL